MGASDGLAAYFGRSRRNAVLSWLLVAVLTVTIVAGAFLDRREPVLFSVVAIAVVAAPAIKFRDPAVVPPWYFVGLVCLPVLWEAFAPAPPTTGFVSSLAVATLGLLMTVELDRFTPLRLVPWFAVVLTVLLTLAMSGLLNVLRWSSDVVLGTTYLLDGRSQDAVNAAVMVEFVYATVAGLVAGVVFYLYFERAGRGGTTPAGPSSSTGTQSTAAGRDGSVPSRALGEPDAVGEADTVENATGVVLSDRLGIATRRQVQLVRFMQVVLAGLFVYGLWSRQIAVVTNAALGLGITFLPAILERDYEVAIEPGLVLWVTLAVFLHALGTAGLYDAISTWDHLTHTLSATVVAATGYAALRAIHLHSDTIHLPRWALFSCLLVFMLAMSVIWEIFEFVVDQGALRLDMEPILAQHGINDTIVDMIFNLVGSVIVATWGTVYLTEISESLARTLERQLGTAD
ncbi:hypothetical protein [Halorubrum tibetense]|uniref:Uncharacterized protein n=1 Tax=Halorubrum tibetense TaxID=175631 RepID=A0ABD5SBY4_9EURY